MTHWTVNVPYHEYELKRPATMSRAQAQRYQTKWKEAYDLTRFQRRKLHEAGFKTVYHPSLEAAEADRRKWEELTGLRLTVNEGFFL